MVLPVWFPAFVWNAQTSRKNAGAGNSCAFPRGGLSDAEAKRTHKFQRTASASPTPSRRISPWLSAKAVLLVPLRPPHRPGQTASSASGCLHPQMQSVCAALRLLKKMGTLFMLHGSIAQHLQKVYKIFRYFLSIP